MTEFRIYIRPYSLILLISLAAALLATPAVAEDKDKLFFNKDSPVELTADFLSYDKKAQTYYANGNVVVIQEGVTMKTDGVIMNVAAGKARTSGNTLIFDSEGNTVSGMDLWIDIRKNTAVIGNGRIFYKKENIHVEGDPLRKIGPDSFEGKNISFTTCDCEEDGGRRAWSFYASEANLTLGEYMQAKHAYFRIKDRSVLYTPYLRVAVQRERQTGFLLPSPGYSELRGFVMDNSFFWAISRSRDATFYLDVETARGFGGGLEYRYIRKPTSYGNFYYYNFAEKDIARVRTFREDLNNLSRPESASSNRWHLKWDHAEVLPAGFNIRADVNMVSDDEYFVDFGQSDEKSLESVESNVSVSRNWSVYSLVAQIRLFDNLLIDDDATTLRKLPEITLTASDKKINNTPLYLSHISSFINFSRSEGITGQRLDLQPTVSLPLSPGNYFDLNTSITPRGTFYLLTENPEGRYVDRFLYKAASDLTTTFGRTYQRPGKVVDALRHTIRPKLSYVYIPEANQEALPSFDSVDSVPASNTITYSLNSILTGRRTGDDMVSYHDYAYLELRQSYDIHEATRSRLTSTDKKRPFSDVIAEAILQPTLNSKITGKMGYNVYDNRPSSYDVNLEVFDSRGDSLAFSQRFLRDSTNFIEASVKVRLNSAFDFSYLERYALDEKRSLERTFVGSYTHQCWGVDLTFSKTLVENIVYLSFSLKGIGDVVGFGAQ
ncbi:MAG: LPS-assembly protein LptD [Thermodesulfobacteriota bacterium]